MKFFTVSTLPIECEIREKPNKRKKINKENAGDLLKIGIDEAKIVLNFANVKSRVI